MMSLPNWLPAMAVVNPWTDQTFDSLYQIFHKDFTSSKPSYDGRIVWFFPQKEGGKELLFWHLTSKNDKVTGERLPDLRRSERLPWVRPLIDNHKQPETLDWDYREGDGDIHTYIWLKDHDFVAILKKYKDGRRRIITSYFIDYNHKKSKLRKKYKRRIK